MDGRISIGATLCCASLVAPLGAIAQNNGTENYYFPPKIATFGKTTVAVAGPGKVVVKVLVKADGSFSVINVIRSTNTADNAAALDVARHSTYHPAGRGVQKKPETAFYDFTVNFTGTGAASGDAGSGAGTGASAGGLGAAEAQLHAGKYADAETAINAYLGSHPGDQKATLDLAIAQTLSNDYPSAAATFDKVTAVPDSDKAIASKAYGEASRAAFKAKTNDAAVAYGKKAVALNPSGFTYNDLGMAEDASGDHDAALADLQKARESAASLNSNERVAIDLNLVSVLYAAGKDDQAKPILAEINSLDPQSTGAQNVVANHDIKLAQDADAAEKYDVGQQYWVQAATAAPKQAGSLYGRAAIDEVNKKSGSQLDKAKSLADQGLAAEPNSALSNYAAGYVLAKQGKKTDALTYLNKADASAKSEGDTALVTSIESLIKQVNGL